MAKLRERVLHGYTLAAMKPAYNMKKIASTKAMEDKVLFKINKPHYHMLYK